VNILVTGGAGFIGSHLVDALVAAGDRVTVLDDLSNGRDENCNSDAHLEIGSITDADVVAKAVRDVEVVFHLGALGAVPRSLRDPLRTDAVNAHGTLTVLTCARDAGVRRVVYSSSSSIYGGATTLPTPETVPARPRSPYAVSKLAGEWYCRVFAESFALETVALRYFNVFGPRQQPDATYAAVVPLFTAALLAGEQPTVFGDGCQSRDFTYVDDVVSATLAAARAPSSVSAGVFNVAPGEQHTILELIETLGEVLGKHPEPVFVDGRPGDVRHSSGDATAARAQFGWQPQTPLREGLERYVAWLRDRPLPA
jgi:nucleoside-diphosphate-sugar epimerase